MGAADTLKCAPSTRAGTARAAGRGWLKTTRMRVKTATGCSPSISRIAGPSSPKTQHFQ
jgi:hypothetical protein